MQAGWALTLYFKTSIQYSDERRSYFALRRLATLNKQQVSGETPPVGTNVPP
jgi:hypothetical protein